MTTDQFILLVKAQWERGLIIPESIEDSDPLMVAASAAMENGLVSTRKTGGENATCFSLTHEGWMRLGELLNVEIMFHE